MDNSNNDSGVVITLLIPAQTAIIEALVFMFKTLFGLTTTKQASFNILVTTIMILCITLSVCNAVLGLNKAQKIAGSIALITQAAIVATAQLKNVSDESNVPPITPSTNNDITDEVNTPNP